MHRFGQSIRRKLPISDRKNDKTCQQVRKSAKDRQPANSQQPATSQPSTSPPGPRGPKNQRGRREDSSFYAQFIFATSLVRSACFLSLGRPGSNKSSQHKHDKRHVYLSMDKKPTKRWNRNPSNIHKSPSLEPKGLVSRPHIIFPPGSSCGRAPSMPNNMFGVP